jgi:hypothetical protein
METNKPKPLTMETRMRLEGYPQAKFLGDVPGEVLLEYMRNVLLECAKVAPATKWQEHMAEAAESVQNAIDSYNAAMNCSEEVNAPVWEWPQEKQVLPVAPPAPPTMRAAAAVIAYEEGLLAEAESPYT